MNDENLYAMPEGFDPDGSFRKLRELDFQTTPAKEIAQLQQQALIDAYVVINTMGQAIHLLQLDFMQLVTALVIEEQPQVEPEPTGGMRLILPEGSQN